MGFREQVLECLGKFPEKVKIEPEVISSTDKGIYLLQSVEYNVARNERIRAYLLLPKEIKSKNPAILASHQHADQFMLGKSEPAGLGGNPMYHYGLDLCLRGYVVLCPDHLCFEDRRPPEEQRQVNHHLDGSNYERFVFGKYLLEGSTLQAKYLSDLCRGLDFLESLDFVDADRIGAIGHSLGGQETLWLAWYDPRIKAAVSSCGFSQIRSILEGGINHNLALYAFGLLNIGDIGDLVCDLAPKPFLMTNGSADRIFPVAGIREIAKMAGEKYGRMGKVENFKSIIFEGGHSFPDEVKAEAYGWLDRFLM
ncbi:MAG: alpha/beta hydrolase family protein [Bacteroidota bacterium]